MNKQHSLVIMVILLMLTSSCGRSETMITIDSAVELINAVEELPDRKGSGCRGTSTFCGRDRFEFDVNAYFSVFNYLSVEPGYALDYIYMSDGAGGKPVLYAYQESERPLNSYSDFVRANGSEYQVSYETIEHADNYLAHIQIDDTPEGYFQFAALSIMDDQFYLDWHANYNDTTIIANEEGGFEAFEAVNFFDDPETDELTEEESSYYLRIKRVESKISELNYTPSVVMEDENAVVRFIVFTQWGGFMEVIASIKRSFPHEIVDWKQRTRILYFSGVMY